MRFCFVSGETVMNEQDGLLRQEICDKILSHVQIVYPGTLWTVYFCQLF